MLFFLLPLSLFTLLVIVGLLASQGSVCALTSLVRASSAGSPLLTPARPQLWIYWSPSSPSCLLAAHPYGAFQTLVKEKGREDLIEAQALIISNPIRISFSFSFFFLPAAACPGKFR